MAGSTLVVNEALSFLTVHFDKLGRDSLFSMLSEFFFLEETTAAKQILISECEKLNFIDAISDRFKLCRSDED